MIAAVSHASLAEFGHSEQLVEESCDIFSFVTKANYSPDKAAAYTKAFAEDVPAHFANLEKLLQGLTRL